MSKFRSKLAAAGRYVHASWPLSPTAPPRGASARGGKRQKVPALHLAGYYRAVLHPRIASRSGVISILGHGRGETGIGLARIRKNDEYATRISQSC
jgi:hypothetical protein